MHESENDFSGSSTGWGESGEEACSTALEVSKRVPHHRR